MTPPRKSSTTRNIVATYTSSTKQVFQIPKTWNLDDVSIKWGYVYYFGEIQDNLKNALIEHEYKTPDEIQEDDGDYADLFGDAPPFDLKSI